MWAFLLWFAVVARAAEPLWNGPGVNLLGGPSRDGKILSYVDPATRNLAICDLATGQSRTLTQQKGGEYAYFSFISRDGSRVAYSWFNAEGFYELRIVGTDSANSRTIFRNEEAGFVQPCGWTPGVSMSLLSPLPSIDKTNSVRSRALSLVNVWNWL